MKLYGCLRKAGAVFKPTILKKKNFNDMKMNLINIGAEDACADMEGRTVSEGRGWNLACCTNVCPYPCVVTCYSPVCNLMLYLSVYNSRSN